jgi:hypothetical protein
MTLEEFKSLVKNRPEPDTPGFYRLDVLLGWDLDLNREEEGYSAVEITLPANRRRKMAPYTAWRYGQAKNYSEYYATFEDAFQAMHTFTQRMKSIFTVVGYSIRKLAFGQVSFTGSNCVNYLNYDAQFRETGHSVHSLYHEGTSSIYGKYLGRFPEEMHQRGDIVEASVKLGDDKSPSFTLGIVIESPMSVEQMYRPYFNIDDNYPDEFGTDYYRICFGPLGSHGNEPSRLVPACDVCTPIFEVPAEARDTLIQYRDTLKAKADESRNDPRVDVELVVVGEPVELAPVQVQLTDSVKNYDWIESGKNAVGATIYRCSFRESATAVNELIQKLKEQHPNHEVRFRATHELSYAFEVFTDDHKGEYFPEHSCYSFFMYIIESNITAFADNRQAAVDEINACIREHHIKADNGEDFHLLSPDEIDESKVICVNSFSEIHWTTNV